MSERSKGHKSRARSAAIIASISVIAIVILVMSLFSPFSSGLFNNNPPTSIANTDQVPPTSNSSNTPAPSNSAQPNSVNTIDLQNRSSNATAINNSTNSTASSTPTPPPQQSKSLAENMSNNFNYGVAIPDANGTITRQYGCNVLALNTIHCDPILYPFESVSVKADTRKLFAITKNENDIPFVPGENNKGQAINFHAYYGEFVNITNSQILNPNAFSASFWVKKDPQFFNYGHVVSHVNAKQNAGWFFDVADTSAQSIRFILTNSEGKLFEPATSIPLSSSNFTHIVGTFDGTSTVKVFVNGKLAGTVPYTGRYTADPKTAIRVAMSSYNFAVPWAGTIDDLRLYNRALTESEVDALYDSYGNASSSLSSPTPNNTPDNAFLLQAIDQSLIGHWPFDGHLNDISSSGSHATYVIQAISIAFTPDGRALYTEKNTGRIMVMQNDQVLPTPFAAIPDVHVNMEQGLMGIAVDPEYTSNHYVYVYYTTDRQDAPDKNSSTKIVPFNRVVRFTDQGNIGKNMTVLIDNIPANPNGMHAGGAIAFGPDGKLYITVGNAYVIPASQDRTSLLGKVLRINKDGSMPPDNPFPNSPVYTLGHRNMYGIAFDDKGNGIVTENGDDYYDEINFLVKGGNYGYPNMQPPNSPPELADPSHSITPLRSYWKTIAPAQAIFYTGDKFPELKGKFIVASYNNGRLYVYDLADNVTHTGNTVIPRLVKEIKLEFPPNMISSSIMLAQSPSGDIYYGGYYMYKLESIDSDNIKPIMAPVKIQLSPSISNTNKNVNRGTDILELHYDVEKKQIEFTLSANSSNSIAGTNITLSARIPKILLGGIESITVYGSSGDALSSHLIPADGASVKQQNFALHESDDGKDNVMELRNLNIVGKIQVVITGSNVPIISNLGKLAVSTSGAGNYYPAP